MPETAPLSRDSLPRLRRPNSSDPGANAASRIVATRPMMAITLILGLLLLACAAAVPAPQTGPIACVPNDAGKLVCFRR